jgi:hypothetical protein
MGWWVSGWAAQIANHLKNVILKVSSDEKQGGRDDGNRWLLD